MAFPSKIIDDIICKWIKLASFKNRLKKVNFYLPPTSLMLHCHQFFAQSRLGIDPVIQNPSTTCTQLLHDLLANISIIKSDPGQPLNINLSANHIHKYKKQKNQIVSIGGHEKLYSYYKKSNQEYSAVICLLAKQISSKKQKKTIEKLGSHP